MHKPSVPVRRRYAIALVLAALAAVPAAGAEVQAMPTPRVADYLQLPGGRIYYEVFGDGLPVVLIHEAWRTRSSGTRRWPPSRPTTA